MKYGKLTAERRRVYTLENNEIDHEMMQKISCGYTYSEYAARKTLLENQVFQWDCAMFGFPCEMNVLETDTPDALDIEVFWRD